MVPQYILQLFSSVPLNFVLNANHESILILVGYCSHTDNVALLMNQKNKRNAPLNRWCEGTEFPNYWRWVVWKWCFNMIFMFGRTLETKNENNYVIRVYLTSHNYLFLIPFPKNPISPHHLPNYQHIFLVSIMMENQSWDPVTSLKLKNSNGKL